MTKPHPDIPPEPQQAKGWPGRWDAVNGQGGPSGTPPAAGLRRASFRGMRPFKASLKSPPFLFPTSNTGKVQ